jgi:hypothetical protein
MCLPPEWFDHRSTAIERLTSLGHAELEVFLSACGFTTEQLVAAGVLQRKVMWHTAMLLEHEPTPPYKALFVVRKEHDILLVKKGTGVLLVEAVLKHRHRESPGSLGPRLVAGLFKPPPHRPTS